MRRSKEAGRNIVESLSRELLNRGSHRKTGRNAFQCTPGGHEKQSQTCSFSVCKKVTVAHHLHVVAPQMRKYRPKPSSKRLVFTFYPYNLWEDACFSLACACIHLPPGIKPGTPVSTTGLNRYCVLIPSLISCIASSGRAEISKFSLI